MLDVVTAATGVVDVEELQSAQVSLVLVELVVFVATTGVGYPKNND